MTMLNASATMPTSLCQSDVLIGSRDHAGWNTTVGNARINRRNEESGQRGEEKRQTERANDYATFHPKKKKRRCICRRMNANDLE